MEGDMTYGRIAPRSGLASAHGISVLAGVIDADYRGEIGVMLHNTGEFPVTISHGQRIAQLILEVCLNLPIVEVDSLDETARGAHGFGSTGS
jgi:dUTP pyrophosphatase